MQADNNLLLLKARGIAIPGLFGAFRMSLRSAIASEDLKERTGTLATRRYWPFLRGLLGASPHLLELPPLGRYNFMIADCRNTSSTGTSFPWPLPGQTSHVCCQHFGRADIRIPERPGAALPRPIFVDGALAAFDC